jgi:chemotaxis protein CheY-P-specific phosphatase CheC
MVNFMISCKEVSTKILENWAMMLVDELPDSKAMFNMDESFYCATTNFHGKDAISGSYSVLCQGQFLDVLAHNLLGNEANLTHDQKIDALKEMSNVLTGNLITAFYGDTVTFDLMPPTAFEMPKELANIVLSSNRTLTLSTEGMPIAVSFSLDNPDV